MTISTLLTRSLVTALLLPLGTANVLLAQVTPANDGTGTVVNTNGNQFNIEGGTLSGNGANLFHSLEKLGLNRDQIANFLANPQVQNILTRVVGGDASIINGLIQVAGGNANLYLMNPAGVIFGPNAMINVPGDFVVTTATGIGFGNDQWFKAVGSNDYQTLIGNPSQFAFDLANPGAIFNAGNLTVGEGKNISLIGGTVLNTGTISAPGGDITIAAIPGTSRVKISKAGNLVSLEVELSPNPDKSQKINPLDLPTLLTEGAIFLENTETNLAQGSVITEGVISAAGTQGGQVALIGQQVSVSNASIDVSGVNGGGTVRVGGDYQGKGSIPNATKTLVDGKSQIKADALGQGDGGRVIVWADGNTQFDGKISAKGGVLGGNGGFIETSGRNSFTVGKTALVNTSAVQGETGTWLLDPTNLEVITEGGSDPNLGTISADTIVTNLITNNVTLAADNSITVNQAINANTNPGNLTLQAPTVNLNRPISLKTGSVLSGTPTTVNVGSSGLIQNGVDVVASDGTVNLAAGTYTQGETFISKSLNITGNGASNTTVSGNDATRVFNISGTGTTVNLDSLKITNGSVSNNNGGGILVNSGSTLNLNNSTLSGNRATKGGGIFNDGNELTINNSTISDNIATSDGSSGIYSNNSIIFKENISLSSDILTLNDQTYKGAVTLQGNSSLTGQNINFQSTVDGHHALTISALGTINFEKAVGATTSLTSLTIESETTEFSPNIQFKGNVITTGTQTYNTPITLQADVTLTTTEGDIIFNKTVTGDRQLTVNASGTTRFKDAVNISNLTTDAVGTTEINGNDGNNVNISTSGDQTFRDAINLGTDTTLTSANTTFNKTVTGDHQLTVNASEATTFNNEVNVEKLTTDSTGTTNINGNITTSGDQTFGDAVNLQTDATLTSVNTTFNNTVTGDRQLTVNASEATNFNGQVNVGTLTTNSTGTTNINGNITTTGDQTFGDVVNLKTDTILTSTNTIFNNTVTGDRQLTVNASGTTRFNDAVNISNLTTDAVGTTEINGNISTSGDQTFGDAVNLGNDTTLTSANTTFNKTVTGDRQLTVNALGKITIEQAINTQGKLTLNGETNLNADLTTQGQDLSINGNVTLGKIATISTGNSGNINATGNIQGSHSLNLQAGENLNSQNIDLSNTSGTGATLALTATSGSINTGNLNTAGSKNGGDITIKAKTAITTGAITTSGEKAGNIFIDPDSDVQVAYINAQSSNSVGGNIDITTAQFFRATETFVNQNGVITSLSSAGSQSGGEITIQYGGNGTIPFVVGDATVNGTKGAITSGEFTINPTQSYLFNKKVGNISLNNGIEAPTTNIPNPTTNIPNPTTNTPNPTTNIPNPTTNIPNPTTNIPSPTTNILDLTPNIPSPTPNIPSPTPNIPSPTPNIPNSTTNIPNSTTNIPSPTIDILGARILTSPNQQQLSSFPSLSNYLNTLIPLSLESSTIAPIQGIEQSFTAQYTNYLGLSDKKEVSLEDIPTFLASVQKATGVKSALIYVFFRSAKSESSTENSSLWELNRARNSTANTERRNDDELEVVLVSDQNILPLSIQGITRGQVLKASLQLQQNLTNIAPVEDFLPQSKQLYQWLITPIEDALKNEKITNLTFVLDQGLRSLPLAALYDADSQQYIIEKYSVSLIPSLSLTDTTRQDRKGAKVLGMGADTFSDQNPLPAVPTELTEIATKIWPGQIFLNQDFTVENFKNALNSNQFSIVHLATHGEFKSGDRNNSFVVFSDKKLTLDEFANLGLDRPIDLLTLSACQTALGDPDAELGFAGLAVKTGVRTALGSLWYVSDAGTLALMTSFYNQLKEAPTKADALRQAQLSLLRKKVSLQNNQMLIGDNNRSLSISVPISLRRNFKNIDTSHPYYWSAFTLIGNPW